MIAGLMASLSQMTSSLLLHVTPTESRCLLIIIPWCMHFCINFYCRHRKEMIQRLEKAGLGYFVKNTQQKLGM